MFRRALKIYSTYSNSHHCFKSISTASTNEKNIVSRAILYVPGSDKKKLEKSFNLKVDCLVLNCEDGVAINMKDEARKNVKEILDNPPKDPKVASNNFSLSVRVNEFNSPFFENDIKTFLSGCNLPDTILLPKVHEPQDMSKIAHVIKKHKSQDATINIMIYIESAKAIMNLKDICTEAFDQGHRCKFMPIGLIFGGDDYLASVGAAKTKDHSEILYGRQKLVNTAKAFGLQAIDIVHINFKDLEELEEQCLQGARMGYTGKQVIHPIQIETVQKCFSPSTEQIEWATALVKEYEAHEHDGLGAFIFRGNMIDAPSMKQARNIINLSQRHN